MKKIITITLMLFITLGASAQEGKRLYTKYSNQDGVSAVYISPTMFKLMGQLPDLDFETANGQKVDMASLVDSFSGFYMLNFNKESAASAELDKEVTTMVSKGNFELLMEVKDNGSTMRMYIYGNEKVVNSFVCMSKQGDQTMFFCLEGSINRSDLEKMIADM